MKVAYPGDGFHGVARQPGARTVEGEIRYALGAARICTDPAKAWLRVASRTDRGVSAIGNVVAFDMEFSLRGLLPAFNAKARDILAWAAAEVSGTFDPTRAKERWYRYTLQERVDAQRLRDALTWITGRHNFRRFVTRDARPPLEIRSIGVVDAADGIAIDVRAESFAWNMVRRIVDAGQAYGRGKVSEADLKAALEDRGPYHPGRADPRFLVLVDVDHGLAFPWRADRRGVESIRKLIAGSRARYEFHLALQAAVHGDADAIRRHLNSPSPTSGAHIAQ